MKLKSTVIGKILLFALPLTLMAGISLANVGNLEESWSVVGKDKKGNDIKKKSGVAFDRDTVETNIAIPSDGSVISNWKQGTARVMANYWNTDTVGGYMPTDKMKIVVNDQTGSFKIKGTANSYYANGNPQEACSPRTGSASDECRWPPAVKTYHAPSAYPAIYNGCHYGNCTDALYYQNPNGNYSYVAGAPYPIQINRLTSFPIHWKIDTSARKTTAVFDAAFDIWFNRSMPMNSNKVHPEDVNQNDGVELMIWINNQGYVKGGTAKGGIIQPAGRLIKSNVSIYGVSGKWDVWATKDMPLFNIDNPGLGWDVVSFVKLDPVDEFNADAKWLIDYAATYLTCSDGKRCFTSKVDDVIGTMWVTSAQAGFETWANSENLKSISFSAEPSSSTDGLLTSYIETTTYCDPSFGTCKYNTYRKIRPNKTIKFVLRSCGEPTKYGQSRKVIVEDESNNGKQIFNRFAYPGSGNGYLQQDTTLGTYSDTWSFGPELVGHKINVRSSITCEKSGTTYPTNHYYVIEN